MAKQVTPWIKDHQAKKAIKVLEHNGLIKRGQAGYYQQVDPLVTSGELKGKKVLSFSVAKYQKEMMGLAQESLDRHPADKRDMSTLCISISGDSIKKIKKVITTCRREILGIAKNDSNEDRVYQVNFQLFPLALPNS